MRRLPDVIGKIMEVIPESERELLLTLKSRRESASYAAPEMMSVWWNRTYNVLVHYVFREEVWQDLSWQEEVRKIWINEK